MKSIICLPALDWEWMFQRPQQMMRQFAAHGWKVVYCNRTEGANFLDEVERNLFVCSQLQRLLAEEARFDVVWAPWPDVAHLRGRFKEKLFVYDRMDRFPWWSAEEERMWECCDLIVAAGEELWKDAKQKHRHVCLARNGCNPKSFQKLNQLPDDLRGIHRPLIGYAGALADWVDLALLNRVAEEFSEGSVVVLGAMLGSVSPNFLPQVRYLGEKNNYALTAYLQHMDVGLIPFKLDGVTLSSNPIKMYEYLAAGKPVVATNLPEVKKCPLVWVAANPGEFIHLVKRAVTENSPRMATIRKRWAAANSWENRFRQVEEVINKMLQRKVWKRVIDCARMRNFGSLR
ncbi:MAG: glycosyltransferase [Bacillota bacterium]